MNAVYYYKIHNPQAIYTEDMFLSFKSKIRKTIYRLPYKKRFTRLETIHYVFEEFIRQVLLDIIENNTIFVFDDIAKFSVSIKKEEITGDQFQKLYKLGRFNLDYLKSNFIGHFLIVHVDNMLTGKL